MLSIISSDFFTAELLCFIFLTDYFDLGKVNESINAFKHAIRLAPNHANAHYNLGIAYGEKGMIKEAFLEITSALYVIKALPPVMI